MTRNEFIASIYDVLKDTADNIFIFYFSGHGGKNCLILSDNLMVLIAAEKVIALKDKQED